MADKTVDVRMPDGTIIRGVPEGVSQEEVLERYNLMQSQQNAPAPAPEPESAFSRFASNVGGRLGELAQGLSSVVAPPSGVLETLAGPGGTVLNRMLVQPTIEKSKAAMQAAKEEPRPSFLQSLAEAIPGAGLGVQLATRPKTTLATAAAANPFAPDVTKLYEQSEEGDVAGASGRGAVDTILLMSGTKTGRTALSKIGEGMPSAVRSRLQANMHDSAMGVRAHVSRIADTFRESTQNLFRDTAKSVDAKFPAGAVDASAVRAEVNSSLGELVKTPQNLPKSVQRILEGGEELPDVFGGKLDLTDPSQVKMLGKLKEQGIMSKSAGNWTFEQAQQYRTAIGADLWGKNLNLPGPVRAAMREAYESITEHLQKASEEAGVGKQWEAANKQWNQYTDDFLRSPVKRIINGKTATDVFNQLTGKNAELVNRILGKYVDKGLRKSAAEQAAKQFTSSRAAMQGAFAPFTRWEYRLLATGLPEIGRSLAYLRALWLKGKKPPISPAAEEAARAKK